MALSDCVPGFKIALFLNHRCNLRCRYCYNGSPFDRPMSRDTAFRAVELGFTRAAGGFLVISFFGGEPLLEIDRMEQVVAHARAEASRRRMTLRFSVSTNVTVLDDRRLALLSSGDFHVQASIDGCERAQDANRRFASGRSSWRRAAANLTRLLGAGIDVQVVSVVHPSNVGYLVESYDALRALGARRLYFVPELGADWDEGAEAVLDEQLAALAGRWADSLRAGEDLRLDPFHGKVNAHVIEGSRAPARCAFGERELAVSPRGRIYPCDRLVKGDDDDRLCLGDLDAGLDEARLRAAVERRRFVEPECAACELAPRCTHSCGCANHEQTGDPGRVSPTLCRWERAVIAAADGAANALYAERAPAFMRRFYGLLDLGRRAPGG